MLHKFNYKPVGQPGLPTGLFVSSANLWLSSWRKVKEEAEDIVDQVELSIDECLPWPTRAMALKTGAPQVHAEAAGNIILEGKMKTPDFDCSLEQRAQDRQNRCAVTPAKRDTAGGARGSCGL